MRSLVLASSLVLVTAGAAQAAEPIQTEREGYRLSYIVTPLADGTRLITGRELASDSQFSFRVKGRIVKGEVDGRAVSFLAPKEVSLKTELVRSD